MFEHEVKLMNSQNHVTRTLRITIELEANVDEKTNTLCLQSFSPNSSISLFATRTLAIDSTLPHLSATDPCLVRKHLLARVGLCFGDEIRWE